MFPIKSTPFEVNKLARPIHYPLKQVAALGTC